MYVHIIGRYITYVGTYYSWYTMYVGIYVRDVRKKVEGRVST